MSKRGGTVKFEVCIQALLFPFLFHPIQGLFTGYILSRNMEADSLESKKDLYLVQKYGGRYFEKVLFINLFYFGVSIGITACSIIMNIALVIKTAERHFVYFIATKLMSLASYSFHFVVHLFVIY